MAERFATRITRIQTEQSPRNGTAMGPKLLSDQRWQRRQHAGSTVANQILSLREQLLSVANRKTPTARLLSPTGCWAVLAFSHKR